MNIVIIPLLCCVGMLVSGVVFYAEPAPGYSHVMHKCMEEQRELLPVARTEACHCFADTKTTFTWTVRRAVSRSTVDADIALENTCRAHAFRLRPEPSLDPS